MYIHCGEFSLEFEGLLTIVDDPGSCSEYQKKKGKTREWGAKGIRENKKTGIFMAIWANRWLVWAWLRIPDTNLRWIVGVWATLMPTRKREEKRNTERRAKRGKRQQERDGERKRRYKREKEGHNLQSRRLYGLFLAYRTLWERSQYALVYISLSPGFLVYSRHNDRDRFGECNYWLRTNSRALLSGNWSRTLGQYFCTRWWNTVTYSNRWVVRQKNATLVCVCKVEKRNFLKKDKTQVLDFIKYVKMTGYHVKITELFN